MGLQIKLKDVIFSKHLGYAEFPKLANIVGLYELSGTMDSALTNQITGVKGTSVATSPLFTVKPSFTTFTGDFYQGGFKTDVIESAVTQSTILAVAKLTDAATKRSLITNYNGAYAGDSLGARGHDLQSNNDYIFGINDNGGAKVNNTKPTATIGQWAMMVASHDGVNQAKYIGINGSVTKYATLVNPNPYLPNRYNQFMIGGGWVNFTTSGTADIALVAIYDGILTDAELNSTYQYLRDYLSPKGIAI